MSCCNMNESYVKFLRGTPAAWDALKKKDKDTLYFISEKEAKTGKLYLGDKLIIGDSLDSLTLGSFEDVLLSEDIDPNSLLIYDYADKAWKNEPIDEVLSIVLAVFKGASDSDDGAIGLVPAPAAGEQNFFLRGDGTWAQVDIPEGLEERIEIIEEQLQDNSMTWGEF